MMVMTVSGHTVHNVDGHQSDRSGCGGFNSRFCSLFRVTQQCDITFLTASQTT